MDYQVTEWADLDVGQCTKKQEAPFRFVTKHEEWTDCSPAEDLFITFMTFILAMVAPGAFLVWWLA